ncbi:hypothetical protein QZH41_000753 [Actinostola sp. cb2023]|nr:hypothetical protein QZH41_000753 [Actinostola sp. cb2023]
MKYSHTSKIVTKNVKTSKYNIQAEVEDYQLNSETKKEQTDESPGKSPKPKNTGFWPDPKTYKYAVQLYPDKSSKKKAAKEVIIVDFDHVCRKKGSFTRDKLKNFLKLSCERTNQCSEGFYFVKAEYRRKFELGEPLFEIPIQLDSPTKKKSRKRKPSQQDGGGECSSAKKKRTKGEEKLSKEQQKRKKLNGAQPNKLTPEERFRIMEEERGKRRKVIEQDKEKRRLQKEREKLVNQKRREEERAQKRIERDQLKEQKRHEAVLLKEWSRPREDLELDDLKDLPEPLPVQVKIANKLFGDAVMVVEFLYVFGSLFDIKDEFPTPLNFSMLEDAIAETDAEGVYYDLLQFLLGAILRTHMDEEEDEGLESADSQTPLDLDDDDCHRARGKYPNFMYRISLQLQLFLSKIFIEDSNFTMSDLQKGCGDSEYRWHSRGGFTYADDAGVEFRHREPHIMKALVTGSVYDLSTEEKLKILTALCGQLMTYATSREYVEDGFDKLKKTRREWLSDQWAEQRREKEEAAARYRKRQEERMKQKEELEKKKKGKENEKNQEDGKQPSAETSTQDEPKQAEEAKPVKQTKKEKGKKKGIKETEKEPHSKETKDTRKPDEKAEGDDKNKQEEVVLTKEEEEQIALQKKRDRECREKEYLDHLRKAVSMSSVQPLGRDRIYRRYWLFRSLKGLFVEEDDPDLPRFLETIFEEEVCEDDGEQDSITEGETLDKNQDTENNEQNQTEPGTDEKESATEPVLKKDADDKMDSQSQINQSKRTEIIEKYGKREGTTRWSYIGGQHDFECLISALNPRGHRERVLREALQSDYRYLTKAIEKCPFKEENIATTKKIPKTKTRKQQTVDKSRYKTTEEFLEANLRDQVLDLEDRLWQGGLGTMKVEDRGRWRTKVENGIYSHLSENKNEEVPVKTENGDVESEPDMKDEKDATLLNGVTASPKPMEVEDTVEETQVEVKEEATEASEVVTNGETNEEDVDTEPELMKVEETKELQFSSIPSHLKLDLSDSRLSSSPNQSRTGTPVISLDPTSMPINPAVRELALALLKVEQGIESKYLSLPLGEDEETKRQKQKDAAASALAEFNEMMKAAEEGKDAKKKKTKKSDKEGGDAKTGENKDGVETKEGEDDDDNSSNSSTPEIPTKQKTCLERWEESLMACTSLAQIPEGNWFCPDCRPKEPRRSERRRRAPVRDDDDEDEEEEYDSEEEEDSDEESEFEEESEAALHNAKQKEKHKSSKKSKSSKPKSKKRSSSPPLHKTRVRKESTDSGPKASKRRKFRDSSPSSSVSSTPAPTKRKRNIPSSLRINGRSSVDSSRSPSPVRKSATKRDPRLTGRLIKCGKLLGEVIQHMDAEFFSEPISLAKYPNYNRNPINLSTIQTNVQVHAYNSVEDLISDVRKVFIDCAEHFRPRAKEARAGVRLSAFFETRLSEIGLDMSQRSTPDSYGHPALMDTLRLWTPCSYRNPTLTDIPLLWTPCAYGHPALTDTPLLWTPRSYGHPALMETPRRSYGHPAFTDTRLLWTPRSYGHPARTDTPLVWTPCSYGHPALMDAPLLWTPRSYGHPAPLLRTPRFYGHPTLMDTPLVRTPRSYGHPARTHTRPLRTSRSYGHPACSYGHPARTDTPLLRTPRSYWHPARTDSPLVLTPRSYGHPALIDTPLVLTHHSYGHPARTDTPLVRTPRSYGHPTLTDIPLLRTPCMLLRTPRLY